MNENKTWGSIFLMLRRKAEELGRAPHLEDIDNAVELIYGLPYGGWLYVLGYAGIYPRAGSPKKKRFPMYLDDFTDDQLQWLVKSSAWKRGSTPLERDCWYYPEMIRRWGSWQEAMAAYGFKMHPDYKPYNPLPCDLEDFFNSNIQPIRKVPFAYAER